MAAINLTKGGTIDLEKRLTSVKIGLAWSPGFDADVSAALLAGPPDARRFVANEWFIFYNNRQSPGGAIIHSGDSRRGEKDGDDETISIPDLNALPAEGQELTLLATIHDAEANGARWAKLGAVCTLDDGNTGAALARYDLGTDYPTSIAVQPCSLYRSQAGYWTFKALGAGYEFGLAPFVEKWSV